MSVSRPVHVLHRMVASLSILALLSSNLLAQTGQTLPDSPQQNTQTAPQTNAQSQAEYAGPFGAVHAALFDVGRLEALCAAQPSATGTEKQRPAAQPAERRQADAVTERCSGAGIGKQFRHCDCPLQPGHCGHRHSARQVRRHGARRFDRVADRHAGRGSSLDQHGGLNGRRHGRHLDGSRGRGGGYRRSGTVHAELGGFAD